MALALAARSQRPHGVGRLVQWGCNVLVGMFLVFFLIKADAFLFGHGLMTLRPAAIFAVGAGVLAFFSVTLGEGLKVLRRSGPVLIPFIAMFVWGVLNYLVNELASAASIGLLGSDLVVWVFSLILVGLPIFPRAWRLFVLIALLVTTATLVIDAIAPGTLSILESRAAGFAENPNAAGLLAVVFATSALTWERKHVGFLDAFALVLCATCEVLAQTRAGLLSLLVLLIVYLRGRIKLPSVRNFLVLGLVPALLVGTLAILGGVPGLEFEWRSDIALTGDQGGESNSNQERVAAIEDSIRLISERPVVGWGTGYSIEHMNVGPHNMYLARWVDNGLPGVLAYLWLMLALLRHAYRTGSSEGMMLAGLLLLNSFFSHNLLEERTVWLLLGHAAGSATQAPLARRAAR